MATSRNYKVKTSSKELPAEDDGKNQVVPEGADKPKKKGFFGKSGKYDIKTKEKDAKGKEELAQDEKSKSKKSGKAEGMLVYLNTLYNWLDSVVSLSEACSLMKPLPQFLS